VINRLTSKKLILIPSIVITGFLAFAFLRPATVVRVLGVVAPALHVGIPATSTVALGSGLTAPGGSGGAASGPGAAGAPTSTGTTTNHADGSTILIEQTSTGHILSTPPQENCGRFGNGFHGGKHLFVCPNAPFPRPAN
jgi:hypothetical protein